MNECEVFFWYDTIFWKKIVTTNNFVSRLNITELYSVKW